MELEKHTAVFNSSSTALKKMMIQRCSLWAISAQSFSSQKEQ